MNNVDKVIDSLKEGKLLDLRDVKSLCEKVINILIEEPNILSICSPVTICGDIHGQFLDLLEIFHISGNVPENNYLFLGDIVNRGYQSVEVLCLLLALKLRYPNRVFLLRGNHECAQLTQTYGFYDECFKKFGSREAWRDFVDLFNYLPLCAIIDNQLFALHSGLSPSINTLDELQLLNRIQDIPLEGPMCDLVWSDPDDRKGWGIVPKGAGYTFGVDITEQFLHENNLTLIVRAHQLVLEGFVWMHDDKLITIFSAPNYCGRCENDGAIMVLYEQMYYEW